jgi:hypothetical protein
MKSSISEELPILSLIGAPAEGPAVKRALSQLLAKPELKKFPRGFGLYSLPTCGIQLFFSSSTIDSVAFYGPSPYGPAGFSPYTGHLPYDFHFGDEQQTCEKIVGKPIYSVREKPPISLNDDLPDAERRAEMDKLRDLPKSTVRSFHKMDEYCMTLYYEECPSIGLYAVEFANFQTVRDAHQF